MCSAEVEVVVDVVVLVVVVVVVEIVVVDNVGKGAACLPQYFERSNPCSISLNFFMITLTFTAEKRGLKKSL